MNSATIISKISGALLILTLALLPISAESQDSTLQGYIFAILQRNPSILHAWERIVPSRYANERWVKELELTAGPVQQIIIKQKPFYLGFGCKPHSCSVDGGNYLVFLLAVDGSEAYGMLTSRSLNAINLFFGSPPPVHEEVMTKIMAGDSVQSLQDTVGSAVMISQGTNVGSSVMSVPMRMEGGTYVVSVLINGAITLDFTVDSGAADVSIPADVVMTLMRTGTLQEGDFLEKRTYELADGSTVPSQTFRIRSLSVGNKVLDNVIGSVAPVKGSLLLGQSFLGRFGSWRVDNNKHALILE
jgi:predicted aspartyl protease